TAEELVSTQTEMLKTLGELEVESREIERLSDVTRSGAVAQKTLIERQYTRERLQVMLAAQKEALRLQGLSERQIDAIESTRRLLRDLRIVAPSPDRHEHEELQLTQIDIVPTAFEFPEDDEPLFKPAADPTLILQDLRVHKGEIIPAGATLAVISDLSELFIEGRAFEQDAELLTAAASNNWQVTAVLERAGRAPEIIRDLELLYSASEIDVDSRTLRFYVRLPNEVTRNVPSPNGHQYIEWRYRPGQRLQLRVPVEEWADQIVLPIEAVALEGADAYVFQELDGHFHRVPVQIVYRDQASAVIKHDGSISPGDIVARRGAHQMQMVLKNKSGGGVDPHAGHSH
ncbi:MAG: secretion protein HlyD, partial [Planctomycetales bacterium]|nr:secretion protein HlyD [Planctomycetales bacterium]